MADSWLSFWGGSHRIYVDDVHLHAHYRKIGEDLVALIGERSGATVLDFGCGDALAAPRLAAAGLRVLLYDAAAAVRQRLARRYAVAPGIEVLDDAGWQRLQPASVDAIVVNSVLQYLTREQLQALLPRFRALLAPGGRLLLADVIPPDASMLDDVRSLLAAGARHGFLLAALRGLAATFFSDYRRLRRSLGLTTWSADELIAVLRAHGLRGERLAANIGFSRHRMLVSAVRAD